MFISRDITPSSPFLNSLSLVYKIYNLYSLYKVWESAISHLLALHRLRHGTSPINYVKIQMHGLVPENASQSHGEATYLSVNDPQNNPEPREVLVYVMKDQNSKPCECKKKKICTKYLHFSFTKRIDPREYAYQSGAAMLASKKVSPLAKRIFMIIGGIIGFFTPTLQFHFDPKDIGVFENDPWIGCIALRTGESISAKRLGLLGALRTGLNGRILPRIQEDPKNALFGVVQLVAAIGITLNFFKKTSIYPNPSQPNLVKAFAKLAVIHAIFFSAT